MKQRVFFFFSCFIRSIADKMADISRTRRTSLQRGSVCASNRSLPRVHSMFNCRFSKHFTPRRDADVLRIREERFRRIIWFLVNLDIILDGRLARNYRGKLFHRLWRLFLAVKLFLLNRVSSLEFIRIDYI